MKYPNNQEHEFDHPSGRFTGIVEQDDGRLMQVVLTSRANCSLRIKEGAYAPGEIRYVRSDTPKKRLYH